MDGIFRYDFEPTTDKYYFLECRVEKDCETVSWVSGKNLAWLVWSARDWRENRGSDHAICALSTGV